MQHYLDDTSPNIDRGNANDVQETEGLQITLNGDPRSDNLSLNEFNYPNEDNEYRQQNGQTQKSVENRHGFISSDKTTPHILLNSMSIMHELALDDNTPKSFKVECKLWTNGLDRFFKVCRQLFNDY